MTLAGCITSMLPLSILWIVKLPFLIMALMVLWRDHAEHAFRTVNWTESETRTSLQEFVRQVRSRGKLIWSATKDWATPVVHYTGTVMNRGLWTGSLILFWTFAWSVYCIVVSFLMLDWLTRQVPPEQQTQSWDFCVGVLGWISWGLGEFLIIRQSIRWYAARTYGRPYSITEGPRNALLGMSIICILLSLTLQVLPRFDLSVWGIRNFHNEGQLVEAGIILGLFGTVCGLSALLIGWRFTRVISRVLLLIGVAFPIVIGFAANSQRHMPSTQSLLWLCPIILSAPGLVWGLWGTRRPPANLPAAAVTSAVPAPPVPPVTPAPVAQ